MRRRVHAIEVADPDGHIARLLKMPPFPGGVLSVTIRGSRWWRRTMQKDIETIAAGGLVGFVQREVVRYEMVMANPQWGADPMGIRVGLKR